MKEIRFHGRGGQGAVMGASMLAYAFVIEGKHAASIPMFGFERRGAPVTASIRFDDQPIRDTHLIYEPDCSVVLDPSFARSPAPIEGLKGDGILILNTAKELEDHFSNERRVKFLGMLDATGIALEEIKRPISNTCMLGALARVTGWVSLDSVISCLEMSFNGEALKRNTQAARRGYESVKLLPFDRG
ncbi:MAG: 2-oxoacid:acceptor oxidoreductase family protein [Desulfobacteraceae bacterium]